ncbi:hypothetical protein CRG98_009171 [Punica granatum]|uniref:Agenet domain-containing protein n=1 Tax=Punica granatum TaxID=22663 RepID=A0A2I0KPL5_PUNGR|nr:hypothetical protein CRG98_009171 [Punica granatum]
MSSGFQDARKRKCKKTPPSRRKLLVGSRVEVRSLEDGLLGSWYSGSVIASGTRMRQVRDDGYVDEDGSGELEERVHVSRAVDGLDSGNPSNRSSYRGRIRLVPPSLAINPEELLYGLCVDVYYEDAWWEGVIFDCCEDAKERTVFFPDLGDELGTDICNIRITINWIEGDDIWVRRGLWSFLKVIQEYERQFFLPVSVKQMWYDLRQKEGFWKIKVWMCSDEILWEKMVFKTFLENLTIALSSDMLPFDLVRQLAREESAERPTCVLRPSKKVQKTLGCFPYNPKTVLSWLIDKDILLPRAKVHCRGDSGGSNLAEGRIHREGVGCNCYNTLLTLDGFVSHFGGTNHCPAAKIRLEDGRMFQMVTGIVHHVVVEFVAKIHVGLLELEGKQISLGTDNLTFTLLKPVDYERHDDLDLWMISAAENYVKLNIALDVMHECFEPVKDP